MKKYLIKYGHLGEVKKFTCTAMSKQKALLKFEDFADINSLELHVLSVVELQK